MTPSQQQFYADALALIRSEWQAMRPAKGDAGAWWWAEKLTTWNGAHDWTMSRIEKKHLRLPVHLFITDCIELTQAAASEVLGKLKVPLAVRERRAEDAALALRGKKRRGRPQNGV
jgi:hypothetical protein